MRGPFRTEPFHQSGQFELFSIKGWLVKEKTIAIGDIHGDLEHLRTLWLRLPELATDDTVVFQE